MKGMKNKATVTYIIGDKERTMVPRFWNRKKIFSTSYMFKHYLGYMIYSINKDISLIHFKNVNFCDCKLIECAENTLCIFENCVFLQSESHVKDLFFKGGTFELINPRFVGFENVNTSIYRPVQNLSIIYEDENLESEKKINLNIINPIGNLAIIKNNQGLNDINVNIKNVCLEGKVDVKRLDLRGENIFIGNKSEATSVSFESRITSIYAKKKLSLINSELESKDDFLITLSAPLIEFDNSTLTSEKGFLINENIYYRKKGEVNVTLTDKELCRTNLISILKGYKNELEQQICLQSKNYLKEDTQVYYQQVEELAKNLDSQKENIIDNLSRISIRQLQLKKRK